MSDSKTSLLSDTFSVAFKWILKDIDIIFSSTGSNELILSPLFGNGSWQLAFIPNSSGDNKDYTGIYLRAIPTIQEQYPDNTGQIVKHWTREGQYEFTIDIMAEKNESMVVIGSSSKKNCSFLANGSFSWIKSTERLTIMNHSMVKDTNTLVITALVTHIPPSFVPISLQVLKSIGDLLNRKDISDVRFIIEPMKKGDKRKVIYAQKPILIHRSDYFQTMFSSSFVEGCQGIEGNPKEVRKLYEPITTVKVRNEIYNTYYAMLYFLYTDKVTFGKIISSKRSKTSKKPKDSNPDKNKQPKKKENDDLSIPNARNIELSDEAINMVNDIDMVESLPQSISPSSNTSRTEDIEKETLPLIDNDVQEDEEIKDDELVYFGHHQPLPISAKALYRLADRYNITELAERCFIYLTQYHLCIQNAFSELVGLFAYNYPSYRQVALDFVLENSEEILESEEDFNEVLQGGPSKYIGFIDAWAEIRPLLRFVEK